MFVARLILDDSGYPPRPAPIQPYVAFGARIRQFSRPHQPVGPRQQRLPEMMQKVIAAILTASFVVPAWWVVPAFMQALLGFM
jgi:hypothetical protein